MDLLREEADRLKRLYGPRWHAAIEASYKSASDQMAASPGSIDIAEGRIALCYGLPSLDKKPTRKPPPKGGRGSGKRFPRR